jgi:hypothetical protein
MDLSPLEQDILAVCGGLVRQLPYDDAQVAATKRLEKLGLVQFVMDCDQPTHVTTDAGDDVLRQAIFVNVLATQRSRCRFATD